MPDMSVDGQVYQVRLIWSLHGQTCYNVLHFMSRGSQDIVVALLQVIADCVANNLIPVLSNECTLTGLDYKVVLGATVQEGALSLVADNVGEVVGHSLPSTNAAVIALRTVHAGRRGKGRMFLPGIAESRHQDSNVDATFIAAAVAFMACMIAGFFDADPLATPQFHWMLFSRTDNQFYQINSYAVRPIVSTLRSRKVG